MLDAAAVNRKLGTYICCVAIGQLSLYSIVLLAGERAMWLFYFDPRLGLFVLETLIRHAEVFPGVLSWLSALLLGTIGVGLRRNLCSVDTYFYTEVVLAAPTVVFFGNVLWANMSPAHGFSIVELF